MNNAYNPNSAIVTSPRGTVWYFFSINASIVIDTASVAIDFCMILTKLHV